MLSGDGGSYAVLYYHKGYHGLPFPRVAAFFAAWWVWLLLLLPLPIGLFPDGRLSRRWRWVFRVYYVGCAIAIAVSTWNDATGIVARHIRSTPTASWSSGGGSGHSAADAVARSASTSRSAWPAWCGRSSATGARRASTASS